ncbi:hypothetical protein BDR04DRAFT_1108549 [Suillus decipiens]|nr:hypothetical protein BDR04DRAFT_1108549 [Suillus decipiens]
MCTFIRCTNKSTVRVSFLPVPKRSTLQREAARQLPANFVPKKRTRPKSVKPLLPPVYASFLDKLRC